jgi:hypothetical protein
MNSLAERPQAADQQQELADEGLFLHRGEPLGGLQHGRAAGVARVVHGQRLAVRPDRLRLGDHVQRAAGVQQEIHVGERLQAGPEP